MIFFIMATILSINSNIDQSLRELGHEVISFPIREKGTYSVQDYMDQCPVQPDIFFQREIIGLRVLFHDVHTLPCRSVFWGIDSHLCYWWQMHYAALFDIYVTPHTSLLQRLSPEWLHPYMRRLANVAPLRPFTPHAQRPEAINFVGRLSGTRPGRKLICAFLQEHYGLSHIDNISFSNMLALYEQTRIIPNESITNEVNFRLLEGAGCGCAVISPHVGPDQDCLFEPDKEILIYTSLDSLGAHLERCLHDVPFAEKLGRRAWLRAQKEHLPLHRAQQLLQYIEEFTPSASAEHTFLPHRKNTEFAQDEKCFYLVIMHINNLLSINNVEHFIQNTCSSTALKLMLLLFLQLKNMAQKKLAPAQAKASIYALLDEASLCLMGQTGLDVHKKMLAVACGGAALTFSDGARSNFYLHLYEKIQFPQKTFSIRQSLMGAQDPIDVALNWVLTLKRDKKQCFYGNTYISGCCSTAFDFISLCQELAPKDMRWFAALSTLDHVLCAYPLDTQANVQQNLFS